MRRTGTEPQPTNATAMRVLGLSTLLGLTACGGGGGGGSLLATPAPVIPASASTPLRLAAVGDSISAGWMDPAEANDPVPYTNAKNQYHLDAVHNYVAQAGAIVGAASVTDLAVPGSMTAAMTATQVPQIPLNANVVIVNAGTNDVFPTTLATADFDALISAVRARVPAAKIVVVTIRNLPFWNKSAAVAAWNAHAKAEAQSVGAAVLDLERDQQWYTASEWPDTMHPDLAGVAHLARAVAQTIQSLHS